MSKALSKFLLSFKVDQTGAVTSSNDDKPETKQGPIEKMATVLKRKSQSIYGHKEVTQETTKKIPETPSKTKNSKAPQNSNASGDELSTAPLTSSEVSQDDLKNMFFLARMAKNNEEKQKNTPKRRSVSADLDQDLDIVEERVRLRTITFTQDDDVNSETITQKIDEAAEYAKFREKLVNIYLELEREEREERKKLKMVMKFDQSIWGAREND